jgi:hypothetical protein
MAGQEEQLHLSLTFIETSRCYTKEMLLTLTNCMWLASYPASSAAHPAHVTNAQAVPNNYPGASHTHSSSAASSCACGRSCSLA